MTGKFGQRPPSGIPIDPATLRSMQKELRALHGAVKEMRESLNLERALTKKLRERVASAWRLGFNAAQNAALAVVAKTSQAIEGQPVDNPLLVVQHGVQLMSTPGMPEELSA